MLVLSVVVEMAPALAAIAFAVMDGGSTAVLAMTDAQFADFTQQMRLLVAEEACLWEFPAGTRDLGDDDTSLEHGPWRQEDCSAALHLWLHAGLVSLLEMRPGNHQLITADARAVLVAQESWVLMRGGTNYAVAVTAAGEALAWDEWRALLSALRSM